MTTKSTAGSSPAPAPSLEERIDWLRAMWEIRFFEDECHQLFAKGLVRGTTHLCQGQEAVVVGACRAVRTSDPMLCTYRGHGAVLAKGAPLDRSFGEILGKADGLCGGKGGSMHLADVSVGAFGSFAIVGAHLPIALGTALAAQYTEQDDVTLCFFGDGSTNIGAFHESLNLAAVWSLPVVFLCENNLYGEYSPLRTTTPIERLSDRAAAYAMPGVTVDGNDVDAVWQVTSQAVAQARAGKGPTLIEALTYRQKGHSRSDPAAYRPAREVEAWLENDPIPRLQGKLLQDGAELARLEQVHAEAELAVTAALDRALSYPEPEPESRLLHVYA